MNKGIIILITVLLVVAIILVIFGYNYIDKVNNRYVINYDLVYVTNGLNADYQYFIPNGDKYIYIALKEVTNGTYSYYLSYYEYTQYSNITDFLNYKYENMPNTEQGFGYFTHYNLSLPIVKDVLNNNIFDVNMFYSFNDVYIIFDENSVVFLPNVNYYTYWGLSSLIDSMNKFTYSYSQSAPVLNSTDILSSFNYVFVEYPSYIFGFFGNFINFVVGGNLSWSY